MEEATEEASSKGVEALSSGVEAVAGAEGRGVKAVKRDSGARRGGGEGILTSGRPFSAKLTEWVSWKQPGAEVLARCA